MEARVKQLEQELFHAKCLVESYQKDNLKYHELALELEIVKLQLRNYQNIDTTSLAGRRRIALANIRRVDSEKHPEKYTRCTECGELNIPKREKGTEQGSDYDVID